MTSGHRDADGERERRIAQEFERQRIAWAGERPGPELLADIQAQLPWVHAAIDEYREHWASNARELAGMLALGMIDTAAELFALHTLDSTGLRTAARIASNEWVPTGLPSQVCRALAAISDHASRIACHDAADLQTVVSGLKAAADELGGMAQDSPAPEDPSAAAPSAGLSFRLTGKRAAPILGVKPETLSRWQKKTPLWAAGNEPYFRDLLDRQRGKYDRRRILVLAKWFRAALERNLKIETPPPSNAHPSI